MKPGGDQWQVDDELLTETGRGGLFTNGYLEGEPLISYLGDGETPLFVFGSGKRGITRETDEDTDRIVPGSGYRAITAVTDRRIQFVVGGGRADGDWAEDVRLSDVDLVSVESGLIREQLSITTNDGREYHVYLKDVDTDRVRTFLEEASLAWIQVEELLDEARRRLVDASQYEKSRQYDAAKDAIDDARSRLDEAADVARKLSAEAGAGIQSRIDQVESRYRETKRRVHASRATHLVDEAERHWRDDEFSTAYEQFSMARTEYCEILDIYGLDPDKADAMRDRITRIDSNLDHLSRAPINRANQAYEWAREATDDEVALDHWTEALELYRCVIELDWGREQQRFEGDVDVVRDRVTTVVEEILAARRRVSDRHVERAEELLDAEEYSQARVVYADAIEHLEAAIDLGREFDPDAVEELHERLDALESGIRRATTSVSQATEADELRDESETETTQTETTETDYDDFDNWVTLSSTEDADDAESGTHDPTSEMESVDETKVPSQFDATSHDEQPDASTSMGAIERDDSTIANVLVEERDPTGEIVDAVEALDRAELTSLVTTVWETLGWSTSVSDGYVVARRDAPMTEQTIIAVEAETVTESDVTGLADRREEDEADRAVVLTNAGISAEATRSAVGATVEVLDADSLASIVERESLTDHLPDATA
ncbi:MAG: restriction endonuclease [Halapricum sp.]